jgi:hypothetical protein
LRFYIEIAHSAIPVLKNNFGGGVKSEWFSAKANNESPEKIR